MNITEKLKKFTDLDSKSKLDSWPVLKAIGEEYLICNNNDTLIANKIAEAMYYQRSLMGSSKAYEAATEIDIAIVNLSLSIARIAFGKTKPLIDYLKSALYYATLNSNNYLKEKLQAEIDEINNLNKS